MLLLEKTDFVCKLRSYAKGLSPFQGRKEQPNPSGRNLLIQYRKTIAERSLERIQTVRLSY